MKFSLQQFMNGLIDYAGIFPPARLNMETAVRNHTMYIEGEYGWMLSRFIIPVTQLQQVPAHPEFRYSVIVSPAVSPGEIDQLALFNGYVEMLETRLPESNISSESCALHLQTLQSGLQLAGLTDIQLFIETESTEAVVSAIAAFNRGITDKSSIRQVGFKLRCGGVEQEAFPTTKYVASAISTCQEPDIPIKFTAGMHQPLIKHSHESGGIQHGFINIFAATLLCYNNMLSPTEIEDCLADENPDNFIFTDESFSWKNASISADEIHNLRKNKVTSFGSCSFIEPLEGLNALGLLGKTGAKA